MKSKCQFTILLIFYVQIFWAQMNPINEYPELFKAVQMNEIFHDQKTFNDFNPKYPIDTINSHYNVFISVPDFNLENFIFKHFKPSSFDTTLILTHIENTWTYLIKPATPQDSLTSLIALPFAYIVPGGRFKEVYYWDSYFTCLGLEVTGRVKSIENMVNNFAWLIDQYGHIPNGNRTYYLTRSQPPFFSLMIELLARNKSDSTYIKYKSQLEKEYEFWMRDTHVLTKNRNNLKRVVLVDEHEILNRYWDNQDTPRPESYLHDLKTSEDSHNNKTIYKNLRAAAESGWDFSSRWLQDSIHLKTICTTNIIPVDLNCLLYKLEITLQKAHELSGEKKTASTYHSLAMKRKELIMKYCWNADSSFFYDYNFLLKKQTMRGSLAALFPLFFKMVDQEVAEKVINVLEERYVHDGGLVTTTINSHQQWDYPNGWAPLQWMGYVASKNYGDNTFASMIANRWINLNVKVFFETGKMLEKYNVVDTTINGGGGEYPLQDGFGWTNGVFLKLWQEERSQ